MPNEPLADPRLEAARKIFIACYSSRIHPNDDLQMLSTAIRETKAEELAQALEGLKTTYGIDEKKILITPSHPWFRAMAALASFKELANGN